MKMPPGLCVGHGVRTGRQLIDFKCRIVFFAVKSQQAQDRSLSLCISLCALNKDKLRIHLPAVFVAVFCHHVDGVLFICTVVPSLPRYTAQFYAKS